MILFTLVKKNGEQNENPLPHLFVLRLATIFNLIITVYVFASCKNASKNQQYFLLNPEGSSSVSADYGGRSLLGELHDIDIPDPVPIDDDIKNLPEIDIPTGCFRTQPSAIFDQELGPRFSFCTDLPWHSVADYLQNIPETSSSTAFETFKESSVSITIQSLTRFRDSHETPLVTLDGSPIGSLMLQNAKISGSQLNVSYLSPLTPQSVNAALPRRFRNHWHHTIVSENEVSFLYPLEQFKNQFLVITIHDSSVANILRKAVQTIPQINQWLIDYASEGEASVTEVLFGKQGTKKEYVEVTNVSESNHITTLHITTDRDFEDQVAVFLFSYQSFVYSSDQFANFRLESEFAFRGRSFILDDLLATKNRAFVSSIGDEELRPSYCSIDCPTIGMAPIFEKEKNGQCQVDDFRISEFNPFGIYTDRIDPQGKFIELTALIDCRSDKLILHFSESMVDFPSRQVSSGEIILFAANSNYFDLVNVSDHDLVSLQPGDAISIVDTMGNQNKLREANSLEYYFGSKDRAGVYRAVHSLVYDDSMRETFHAHTSMGLRPDLTERFAMTPGFPNPSNDAIDTNISISELLPMGSRNTEGSSLAGDEFVEFRFSKTDSSKSLSFDFLVNEKTYRIPYPASDGYISFFQNNPVCFASNPRNLVFPDLSLPNASATYTIKTPLGVSQSFNLPPAVYSEANQQVRRSILYLGNAFAYSNHLTANLCPAYTAASPGDDSTFDGFLLTLSQTPGEINALYLGPDQTASLHLAPSPGSFAIQETIELTNNTTITAPSIAGNERSRYRLDANGIAIGFGELIRSPALLYIQSVAPTPSVGHVEWIRVCSRRGFSTTGERLFISDMNSADEVVPAYSRSGSIPVPEGLQSITLSLDPGRCAIVVDPDYSGQALPLVPEDQSFWTIASTSTLGNGLSAGESIYFHLDSGETICTYGRFDLDPFTISTENGQYVNRRLGTNGDSAINFEVENGY